VPTGAGGVTPVTGAAGGADSYPPAGGVTPVTGSAGGADLYPPAGGVTPVTGSAGGAASYPGAGGVTGTGSTTGTGSATGGVYPAGLTHGVVVGVAGDTGAYDAAIAAPERDRRMAEVNFIALKVGG